MQAKKRDKHLSITAHVEVKYVTYFSKRITNNTDNTRTYTHMYTLFPFL